MDTKRLLTTMLVVGAVFLLWQTFFNKGGNAGANGAATTQPSAYPLYTAIPKTPQASEGGATPQTISLGNALDDHSKMQVNINTQTAGIDSVQLNIHDYAQTVKRDKPLTLFEADPALVKPFSTLGICIKVKKGDGWRTLPYGPGVTEDSTDAASEAASLKSILDTQYVWKVESKSDTDLELSMSFQSAGKPVAKVFKTFHVDPATYEIRVAHRVQNLSGGPIQVQIDQFGPISLPRDDPQTDDRYYHAANYDVTAKNVDSAKSFNATQLELPKYVGGTKSIGQMNTFNKPGDNPAVWIAASNRFFTTIERPLPIPTVAAERVKAGDYSIPVVTHVASSNLDVMKFSTLPGELESIVRLTGQPMEIAPNATLEEPFAVFLGPKQRDLLAGDTKTPVDSTKYSHAVYDYFSLVQLNQGGCYKYCTFESVAWVILWLLDFFKRTIAFGNYGVAIMILVLVVRAVLHPLTRASQINMAKMGKKMKDVQPRIEAIKKKYAGNKQKTTEETMRIYREEKVNPAGGLLGCLPMTIQMPIWAALWSGLRTDIDLRHAAFIPGWINDLSHPDTIFPTTAHVIGHPLFTLPLLGEIYGLNLLPLLLTVVFFFQMKVTTALQPKAADPQQAQMQKMSQYMIFIFPLFLYSAPSGLNLYIFASTMGGLVDTWLVRKSLKKQGILPSDAPALPTHEEKIVEPR
jgi:YidC/Oxa1 family membrane protein insertase